ncbi:MAG: HEPN domain-containing protein [Acidimicrobiia bacterium]
MKPDTENWVRLADEDLRVAKVGFESSLFRPCVFHCQQALEKLLKAVWIERASEGLPRRTHDLVGLADELQLELADGWVEFLRRLSEQYMPSRYGDVPVVEISRESAENYLRRTEEIFAWLLKLLN